MRPSSPNRQLTFKPHAELETSAFSYGYLARLIDDSELSAIEDREIRAGIRQVHREVYWKALRLLQRDVRRIRLNRRKMMEARQEWQFEKLIGESVRMTRLLWTLRIAGIAHTVHVPFMIASVRDTCAELNRLMAAPLAPVPAGFAA